MSIQTGIETPRGPESQQLSARLRHRWQRFRYDPNPLWMREMRQNARLTRTPYVLMVLTMIITMIMTTIGGAMVEDRIDPAQVGQLLFQVFFSLGYFLVGLFGPALAANSIASEREGYTWEAVLLTGMRPAEITRGKFWAAYTSMAQYLVMLAPAGALPFLFGGVTPMEVVVAFSLLFVFAALAVAFGLALSSKMKNARGSLLVSILAAVPLTFVSFGLGWALTFAAHELWPAVERGGPVWLPIAYVRAPFDLLYVGYLIVVPLVVVVLPAWFLYEITKSNLTSVTDDQSFGLKRWHLVSAPILATMSLLPLLHIEAPHATSLSSRPSMLVFVPCSEMWHLYLLFVCMVLAGDAIGPSRRVRSMLQGKRWLRRALGPGVMASAKLQLVLGIGLLGVIATITGWLVIPGSSQSLSAELLALAVIAAYPIGFFVFAVGLIADRRGARRNGNHARWVLLFVGFALHTVPWLIALILGLRDSDQAGYFIAAAAPSFRGIAIESLGRGDEHIAVAAIAWSVVYLAAGLGLLLRASRRCRAMILHHEQLLAEADALLAAEEAGTSASDMTSQTGEAAQSEVSQPT